jgi:WD40 repeat protein
MANLANDYLFSLIFSNFSLNRRDEVFTNIKNKAISRTILNLTDYKTIFKSIELDKVIYTEHQITYASSLTGSNIITASNEKAFLLWNMNSVEFITFKATEVIGSLIELPNGNIASCSQTSCCINIWDSKNSFKCIKSTYINGYKGLYALLLLSNSNIACSAKSNTGNFILILDSDNAYKCIKAFDEHTLSIVTLINLPDNRVASGSYDTNIKIWDLDKYLCLKTLSGHNKGLKSLLFAEKSKLLISGSRDETIKFWELNDYNCIKTIQLCGSIRSLLLLPGGYFAAGGNREINIWDIKTFECVNTLKCSTADSLFLSKNRIIISISNILRRLIVWNTKIPL